MTSPKKAAQRYDAIASGSPSAIASSSSAGPSRDAQSAPTLQEFDQASSSHSFGRGRSNLMDKPPSLAPPEPEDPPIPAHTNLETAAHVSGPPPWPTATYRHLLSAGTLNPTNPLRVIAHCDVDAAYAQFEASRLGLDATVVPIAVQQWQGLIAVNYPARDAGVSRFESIPEALKKCPDLHLVHVATYAHGSNKADYFPDPKPETHKVSLDPYRRESNKILAIFKKTCPRGAVEKASIDESYFDLTVEVRKLMVERFPYLANPPPDDPVTGAKGMDQPLPPPPRLGLKQWKQLGYVVPKSGDVGKATGIGRPEKAVAKGALLVDAPIGAGIISAPLPPVSTEKEESKDKEGRAGCSWGSEQDRLTDPTSSQQEDLDEEAALWDRIEYGETTWTDVALALGAELLNRVRQNVLDELNYTTSAGIACNKTLAKLCSSWRKPNGQTIMRPCSVANFYSSLPFQKIRFLGGKLGNAMGLEWNSATVSDLWQVGLDEMQAKFGEEARWVYNVLRGIDYSEVRERVNNQTMLASKSVRPAITKPEEAMHWLSILATELAIRLREAREERTNLWPKTLVLRYIRAGSVPRSRQTAFPFTDPRNQDDLAKVILKKGQKLWEESVGDALGLGIGGSSSGGDAKVLTIALGFGALAEGEVGQRGITGFLGAANTSSTSSSSASASASVPSKSAAPDASDEQASPRKKKKLNRLDHLFETQSRQQQQRSTPPPVPTSDDKSEGKNDSTQIGDPAADPSTKAEVDDAIAGSGDADREEDPRWACPECAHVVTAPPESAWFEKPYLVEKLKDEHLDWHFAVSLSQAPQPSGSTASRPSAAPNLPATQKKKRALDKFFTRR
ncbi:protein involved in establishing cohesion between sister chromatids during DNA replication [Moesziomyces antarcticus T-34]|uniref:DNA polymerase eta n=1 Tax=Pseudozyma antarctica (strain T-34) TaxID=1151754 RepID=M9MC88_PSEA3|nr:protein involved in establishing cohesion between sister chromatids during DNA replication [Moesziomyces antarcticus T-34]